MEILKSHRTIFPVLFKLRTIWFPTVFGAFIIVSCVTGPASYWLFFGEQYLSRNLLVTPDILVIDGWIHEEPILDLPSMMDISKFRYIIATGGYTGESWSVHRWSYTEIAEKTLRQTGISASKLLSAQTPDCEANRTFQSALAVKACLEEKAISPKSITIYTRGAHAMRSKMVYSKVFGPKVIVGVFSWNPRMDKTMRWWQNSDRAENLIKETVGCAWELFFNSGR